MRANIGITQGHVVASGAHADRREAHEAWRIKAMQAANELASAHYKLAEATIGALTYSAEALRAANGEIDRAARVLRDLLDEAVAS